MKEKKKKVLLGLKLEKQNSDNDKPDFSLVPDSDLQRASFIIIIFLLYEIGSGPKWI